MSVHHIDGTTFEVPNIPNFLANIVLHHTKIGINTELGIRRSVGMWIIVEFDVNGRRIPHKRPECER